MKRHPALQDLSRDHHLVLIEMQNIRRALAAGATDEAVDGFAKGLLAFYRRDMAPHFEEEDTLVVPLGLGQGDADTRAAAGQVRAEHAGFRARFRQLEAATGPDRRRELLLELEPLITAHVKAEEERLFEGVQRSSKEAALQDLWRRSHEFRRTHREPAACGIGPPAPRPARE